MRISVTQEHLNKGVQGSCSQDPISLAMKDSGLEKPWVSPDKICWRKDFRDYSVSTPNSVYSFLLLFDNGKPVVPFSFELEGV